MIKYSDIVVPHGGYQKLIVYRKSDLIYQGTVLFCRRFVNAFRDRTYDQMVQAARSCKQNIAEGSASSGTSKETEMKLTGVARGSLDELKEDFIDFLNVNHYQEWDHNDNRKAFARKFSVNNPDWSSWEHIFKTRSADVYCNLMLVIIYQTMYLLDRMLESQEKKFTLYGGIRERMYNVRKNSLSENCWSISLEKRLSSAQSIAQLRQFVNEIMQFTTMTEASIRRKRNW